MEYVKLDELCDSKIERLSREKEGEIDYIDISSVDNKEKKITAFQTLSVVDAPSRAQQLLNMNDILVSTVRPNLNAVAVCDIESENIVVASTGYCVLRCKNNVDYRYVFHFCKSKKFISGLEKLATGASYPAVSNKDVRESLIPLFDFNIQKNISDALDKAQELIDKRKEQIAACDELIKSLFYHMFGDPIVNPQKWDIYILRDIAESRLGKMLDVKKQTGKYKYPYLANYNVQWFYFELSSLNQMDFDEKDRNEFDLKYGDVLVTEGGEVGRCAIWKEQIDKCYFQKALHRIRCDTFIILPEYLVRVFYFRSQHNQFEDVVGSKSTIAHLTGEKLKALKIPVPPIDLQNDFAKKVEKIEQQKQLLAQSLTELENNFNSLMQRAFKGELF